MAEAIELNGTVKKMSPSGKGFLLNEYENWFNFGSKYDGPRPFAPNAVITITYEEKVKADGTSSFFVLSAWPTTGQAGPHPQQVTPPGPKPTAGPPPMPTPTNGPAPTPAPSGPTPTPPDKDKYIMYEVALKEAREWVLGSEPDNSPQRTLGHLMFVADTLYLNATKVIEGDVDALLSWAKTFIAAEEAKGPEEPA